MSMIMISKKKRLVISCQILLALVIPLQAQDEAEEEEKKVSGFHFTAIELGKLPYEKIYYRKGKEFVFIELITQSRSAPYSLDQSSQYLELYTENENAEDLEEQYKLIGKAPLIQGATKMLYFLRSKGVKKKGVLPIEFFGLDDSPAKFPKSSYRFVNFINIPLGIEFNKKHFVLKRRQDTVRKVALTKDGAFTPFIVWNAEGEMLAGTRLFSHADSREMVLIFPPKEGQKRLDIRFFSD